MTALAQVGGKNGVIIDLVALSWLQWIEKEISHIRTEYRLLDDYYRGRHRVLLTDRMKRVLHQDLRFTDNFCEVVVDAAAERMNVIGFSGAPDPVIKWVWDLWNANRMDQEQGTVHTEAMTKGDAYVMVDFDDEAGRSRMTFQQPELIIPHYDPATRRIKMASKKWVVEEPLVNGTVTKDHRLNLYYPERVEKYIQSGGSNVWVRYLDEGDSEWPLPWVDRTGAPLGIPIIHFRNNAKGDDFGHSEIATIVPLQDMINKTLVDLFMGLDGAAFGQRWTINIAHGTVSLESVPGSLLEFHGEPGETPQVGEFTPLNVDVAIKTLETLIQHIAARSRTPQNLFQIMRSSASGESLRMSESGLVHKIGKRQIEYGNAWEDTIQMALRVQNTFGDQVGVGDERLETEWDGAYSKDESVQLLALEAKSRLGVPQKQIWREMGYTDDQIATMLADKAEEQAANANLGATLLAQFDQGQGVPQG